ncbi:MAG TPA: endo-1,4-beta-xylanase [Saprospiraceae bacterium]|nr:endo-1,4-beta-xylanase [Saprospiraceae bacterium]
MKYFSTKLLFALFTILFTNAFVHAQNLIPNPGFEAGTGNSFEGWNAFNQISGTFSQGTGTGEYRSGTRALKGVVTMAGEAWHLQLASNPIETQVGEEYTYSVWVKGANAGTSIRFSTQPNALYSANYAVSTDWTELSWTFTANEAMTRVVLDIGTQVNTYFLDDMTLSGPSGDMCVPIANGGFEDFDASDTTFTGWQFYNENGGSSFELGTGANAFAGDQSLKAINAGGIARWGLQAATPAFPTIVGQSYTLQLWIKADTGAVNFIQFSTRDGNGANEGQYTNSATMIGSDWMQLSYTFSAISDMTIITLNLGDETANTYYLDELCVIYPDLTDNCEAVANGSFETYDANSGTFANWTYYNRGNGSTFGVSTAENNVYEGANALVAKTTAGTETYQLQIASPSFYTLKGGTYQFKIWIKADSAAKNTIQFSLRDAASPGTTESQYTTSATTIGGDWMQVTYQFTATSGRSLVTLNLGGQTANTFYIDAVCTEVVCGTTFTVPADQEPIATGKEKFLGNVYAGHALPDFEKYFNQVTPENSGKWGSVETQRDVFNWDQLDAAVQFAKDNNFIFRFHVMLWGAQQPAWLEALSPAEQVEEIKEWFEAVSTRYGGENAPEYLEVVNEPLNQPPFYQDALTSLNAELGTTPSEYDWVVNAFKLANQYFGEETKLMINEYGIENTPNLNRQYVEIIKLLQADDLIDAVGFQGHTFSTRKYGGSYENLNNNLKSNLDNLAQLGLPLVVTEMEIEGDMYFDNSGEPRDGGTQEQKDSFQLAEYQRIFEIYWYHPSVVGITMWGWRPGLWQDDAEAYLIDPCTGQERPALNYLNTVIRDSNPKISLVTDVVNLHSNDKLDVYPTISTGELIIEGLEGEKTQIQIFNTNGQMMKSLLFDGASSRTLDVSGLPVGFYFIKANNAVKKFVKQ